MSCLLILAASLNALFLFTDTKLYHLYHQPDPVASPHARFVSAPTDPPALTSRLRTRAWSMFLAFWRFLLGITLSSSPGSSAYGGQRVQELEVWTPSERGLMLFCIYSPVHVFLWMLWNAGNWVMMAVIMVGVSFQVRALSSLHRSRLARSLIFVFVQIYAFFQVHALTTTYEALLKDRTIIAAEVLHEYDEKVRYCFPLLSRSSLDPPPH